MAITPLGFEGTVNDVAYSKRSRFEGAQFPVVDGRPDFAVTVNLSADRTFNIAPGTACAHAIMGTATDVHTVQSSAVSTPGATVLRYDWAANTITPTKVEGTAAAGAQPVLPAGLNTVVGETFDQVLALGPIIQGQTLPGPIVDMRMWASKVITAGSLIGLPTSSPYGTEVALTDGSRYRRLLDSSNNAVWVGEGSSGLTELLGTGALTVAPGWSADSFVNSGLKDGRLVTVDIALRRSGATLTCAAGDGNFPDTPICTLVPALRPHVERPVLIHYVGSSGHLVAAAATLTPDGVMTLVSGVHGENMLQRTTTGTQSIRATTTFMRKVA